MSPHVNPPTTADIVIEVYQEKYFRGIVLVKTVGYIAKAYGVPHGGDDAAEAKMFSLDNLAPLAFDHNKRIWEYLTWRRQQPIL